VRKSGVVVVSFAVIAAIALRRLRRPLSHSFISSVVVTAVCSSFSAIYYVVVN
jgi:hypothetical protein